jgi:hypothetical protein
MAAAGIKVLITSDALHSRSETPQSVVDYLVAHPNLLPRSARLPGWRESNDRVVLTIEHRAAAPTPSVALELIQRDDALALEPVQSDHQTEHVSNRLPLDHQRITAALAERW